MLRAGTYASVYLVVVMMMIISGRVVPAFTRNALTGQRDGRADHRPSGSGTALDRCGVLWRC